MKTMLITGAGRGIGAATALQAARRGHAVAVNYRECEDAEEAVVSAIVSQGGRAGSVVGVTRQVRDSKSMRRFGTDMYIETPALPR